VNRWEEEKPGFHFISFAPHANYDGVTTTMRDGIGCSTPAVNLLTRNGGTFLNYVQRVSGCEIIIPPVTYRGEDPREIGFIGTKESIAVAKEMVFGQAGHF